jgi:nitrogen fixation protein NifU and related proteins
MDPTQTLYAPTILRHARDPIGRRLPYPASGTAVRDNPLCGDRVEVAVAIDAGVLRELGFEGRGCALTIASASMMVAALSGRPLGAAEGLSELLLDVVERRGADWPSALGELAAFAPVIRHPSRTGCVCLPWQALRGALGL